jgi:hypothetical protein
MLDTLKYGSDVLILKRRYLYALFELKRFGEHSISLFFMVRMVYMSDILCLQ